jgi:hypothetical protein
VFNIVDATFQKKYEDTGISPSLLKSAVQKAVRRREVAKALQCSKVFIKKYPNEFWRRLAIIIIEDGVLHPEFRKVVNLASESSKKSYIPIAEDEEFGLRIVEQLAESEWRDFEFEEYIQRRQLFENEKVNDVQLSEEELDIIKAISWRGKMGGMRGDMTMLDITVRIFERRFKNKEMKLSDLSRLFKEPTLYKTLNYKLKIEDILVEAVDFHCSPLLNILLKKEWIHNIIKNNFDCKTNDDIEKKLKDITWRFRSAVSTKKLITTNKPFDWLAGVDADKYQNVFSKLRVEMDNISRWFVKKQLEREK